LMSGNARAILKELLPNAHKEYTSSLHFIVIMAITFI